MSKLRAILKKIPFAYKMAKVLYAFRRKVRVFVNGALRPCGVLFRKQSLILSPKYKKLKSLANIHHGERCFIVCTGPSLTLEDLEKLNDNGEICFSMNSIVKLFDKTRWRPLYYSANGRPELNECVDDAIMDGGLKNLFFHTQSRKIAPFEHKDNCNVFYYPVLNDGRKFRRAERIDPRKYTFSDNLYRGISGGATVTNALIQIAVYMGFKEIYLLGCDCDGSVQHHFGPLEYLEKLPQSFFDHGVKKTLFGCQKAKEYADAHGIKIYNATRGGKLEVFERVDLTDVLDGA